MTLTSKLIEGSVKASGNDSIPRDIFVLLRVGAADHIWVFYVNSANDLGWRKSTDGGGTWGSINYIDQVKTWEGVSVWFDRWSPNDTTGNTIHIIASQSTDNAFQYFTLGVDDDTAEAVNDVEITTVTTLSTGQHMNIIASTDGTLYTSFNSTSPLGYSIWRSGDSGATWNQIYNQTEWVADADDAGETVDLVPLKTDNDILAIHHDQSANTIGSIRYDGTKTDATGWGTFVSIGTSVFSNNTYLADLAPCVSNDDGDVYLCYTQNSNTQSHVIIKFSKYDESAGTWLTEIDVEKHAIGSAGYPGITRIATMSLSLDTVDGALFLCIVKGILNSSASIYLSQSYDDGITWGEFVLVYPVEDDFRLVWLPKQLEHTDSKLPILVLNDDLDNLECYDDSIPLLRKTGIVKDDAGVAVTTARCHFFRIRTASTASGGPRYVYLGAITSDASGNWSVPLVNHQEDITPEYQVLYDDDLANDETDASRRFSS